MKPPPGPLENLLALKRHETPPEGYWQDFLCEHHQLRRQHALESHGFIAWFGRTARGIKAMGGTKWAYGAGLAYATATIAFILLPRGVETEPPLPAPVKFEVVSPPPLLQLNELNLDPSNPGNPGEQVF